MCNPVEQLILKVHIGMYVFCFNTQKNAKIVQKNNNVSSKTETKVGSRKKFHNRKYIFQKIC